MDLFSWIASDHASILPRFEASVAAHVPRARWRERADGGGASIAYLLFHSAVHEDLAVTTAIRGEPPLRRAWADRLGLEGAAASAGLGESEQPELTAVLELDALLAYADAVSRATRWWLARTDLKRLDDVPDASERLTALAMLPESDLPWLHQLWADKPISYFLQWEAIAHRHGHLAEMISVRGRLGLSPF
jgi:hypothetical protein